MPLEAIEFTPEEQAYFSSRGESEKAGKAEEGRQPPPPGEEPLEALEPVTQAQDDDDEDEGPHRSETVPYGRYRKERERRKALASEIEESKVKMARFEERLAILNELMESGGGQQAEVKGKDAQTKPKSAWEEPNIDPLEDFAGAMDQLTRRQMEQNERDINRQKMQEGHEADKALAQSYAKEVLAFAQNDPSFAPAYKHLMQGYHRELEAFGMKDVAARNAHILQEEKKLAAWAFENKQPVAQVIYNMALARGFTKQQVEDTAENHAEPEVSKVKDRISTINKGQKSTASLSSGGGGANKPLTADALLNMDDDEFYERVHKAPKHVRRRLLGGE